MTCHISQQLDEYAHTQDEHEELQQKYLDRLEYQTSELLKHENFGAIIEYLEEEGLLYQTVLDIYTAASDSAVLLAAGALSDMVGEAVEELASQGLT